MKVLIVGAGPAGLTAAVELARRGIVSDVIDLRESGSGLSRAVGITPASLDILGPSGVAEKLLAEGMKFRQVRIYRQASLALTLPLHVGGVDGEFILGLAHLDSFHKVLENLTKERDRPNALEGELTKFRTAFPHLKGIRDSAHHIEDRGLGRDRRGNPLKLKPIDNGIVRAPGGGILLLSVLEGNKLWYTLEDGRHGELAVSHENMAIAAEVFQSVINAFRWRGRSRLIPS